jgi:hypothetical protein
MPSASAPPTASSPTVTLFQKAHAKLSTLQRIDDQFANLIEQRRRLQEEIRSLQAQINDEFDRVMDEDQETPARALAQIAEGGKSRMRVAE